MAADQLREIRQKAGGMVLLLPKDPANMSTDEKDVRII